MNGVRPSLWLAGATICAALLVTSASAAPAKVACATASDLAIGLSVTAVAPPSPVVRLPGTAVLQAKPAVRVRGRCAASIVGARMSQIRFRSGTTIELGSVPNGGRVSIRVREGRTLFDDLKAAHRQPRGRGPGKLTAWSDSVDPGSAVDRYIGAYERHHRSIAAFIDQERKSGRETVLPIFEMLGSVRGIHYFPALDVTAGTITTLHSDAAGATVSWFDVSR